MCESVSATSVLCVRLFGPLGGSLPNRATTTWLLELNALQREKVIVRCSIVELVLGVLQKVRSESGISFAWRPNEAVLSWQHWRWCGRLLSTEESDMVKLLKNYSLHSELPMNDLNWA